MKHKKKSTSQLKVNQVRIEFTNKPLTSWGGICTIIAKYFESIELREWIESSIPITETSPNARGVYPKLLAHFLTVLCGGRRFSHIQWWTHGPDVICSSFGVDWLPAASSVLTRFWDKINSQDLSNQWNSKLRSLVSTLIEADGIIEDNLNLDSSVVTRYGKQKGAIKGYNPKKPGRKSHHPLLAFLGAGYVVNLWNRSGNVSSAHQCVSFYSQTCSSLPKSFSIKYVLADSGFYNLKFIEHLEEQGLRYIIAVPFMLCLQNHVINLPADIWQPVSKGIDVAEFYFQHKDDSWTKPRRYILVRKNININSDAIGRQPDLFKEYEETKDYRYNFLISNANDLSPVDAWREIRPRSKDENVIKELKNDYGWDAFNLDDFWATEAVLSTIALLYHNLIHYIIRNLLSKNSKNFGLGTLRMKYFIFPAILGSQGRTSVLRAGVQNKSTKGKLKYWLNNIP